MDFNLNLHPNEGILLQNDHVWHQKKRALIYLTNMNFICVEKNTGVFKTTYDVLKYPVSQIKVVDGCAQATVIKENGEWVLQILLRNGVEKYVFEGEFLEKIKRKQEADMWVEKISQMVTGNSPTQSQDSGTRDGIKSILKTVGISKQPEKITVKCIGCMAPISGEKGKIACCKYCDTEQTM